MTVADFPHISSGGNVMGTLDASCSIWDWDLAADFFGAAGCKLEWHCKRLGLVHLNAQSYRDLGGLETVFQLVVVLEFSLEHFFAACGTGDNARTQDFSAEYCIERMMLMLIASSVGGCGAAHDWCIWVKMGIKCFKSLHILHSEWRSAEDKL